MLPETIRNTAYAWHRGGGSPLYQFASTDGQMIDNRAALLGEIDSCLLSTYRWLHGRDRARESVALRALRAYVEAL